MDTLSPQGKLLPSPGTVFPHQNHQNMAKHSSSLRVVSKYVNIASDFYILFFFFFLPNYKACRILAPRPG